MSVAIVGRCRCCCREFKIRHGKLTTHKYNGARCPGAGRVPGNVGDAI